MKIINKKKKKLKRTKRTKKYNKNQQQLINPTKEDQEVQQEPTTINQLNKVFKVRILF